MIVKATPDITSAERARRLLADPGAHFAQVRREARLVALRGRHLPRPAPPARKEGLLVFGVLALGVGIGITTAVLAECTGLPYWMSWVSAPLITYLLCYLGGRFAVGPRIHGKC